MQTQWSPTIFVFVTDAGNHREPGFNRGFDVLEFHSTANSHPDSMFSQSTDQGGLCGSARSRAGVSIVPGRILLLDGMFSPRQIRPVAPQLQQSSCRTGTASLISFFPTASSVKSGMSRSAPEMRMQDSRSSSGSSACQACTAAPASACNLWKIDFPFIV